MTSDELASIRDLVRRAAERIQSQLLPVPGLSRRNAAAHLWLGVRERFGEEWRVLAEPASVLRFIAWMESNPNASYEQWDEGPEFRKGAFTERLF